MMWEMWIDDYIRKHCIPRGLQMTSVVQYNRTLQQFAGFARFRLEDRSPMEITQRDVMTYLEYLKAERGNSQSTVNGQVVVLRNFYKAMVALKNMEPRENPMTGIPTMRAAPTKIPQVLTREEQERMMQAPSNQDILGLRDRALVALHLKTGVRASETVSLTRSTVDFETKRITVLAKGGHQRVIPITDDLIEVLQAYLSERIRAKGPVPYDRAFFVTRTGRPITRQCIYERIRKAKTLAQIEKRVTPHTLRHTFATELVMIGAHIAVIRDLLGHKCLSSTQIYLHVTGDRLREVMERHPIDALGAIADFLPKVKLPWQRVEPPKRSTG